MKNKKLIYFNLSIFKIRKTNNIITFFLKNIKNGKINSLKLKKLKLKNRILNKWKTYIEVNAPYDFFFESEQME